MNNFHLLSKADVNPLMLQIKMHPELWKEDTYLRDYPQGPFGEIESIMLRFPEKRVFEQEEELEKYKQGLSVFDQHESIDYPAFDILTEAKPVVKRSFSKTEMRLTTKGLMPGLPCHSPTPAMSLNGSCPQTRTLYRVP